MKLWTPNNPDYALALPLAALCLLLGSVLLAESLLMQRSGSAATDESGAAGRASAPDKIEPEQVFELPPLEEFSAFVDRPLFMEGRKPAVEAEQSQTAAEEDKTPLNLNLMGVMLSPRGEMAILAEASGKNRRVKLGGGIGGWRLVELKPDRVTLQRGDERRELPLLKPRAKGPAVAGGPPAQPPSGGGVPRERKKARPQSVPQPEAEPEPESEGGEPDAEVDESMDLGSPEGEE